MSNMIRKLGVVVLSLMVALVGCGSGGGGDPPPAALTENDFADDPDLSVNLERTVVMFLEDPTDEENPSDQEEPSDTGEMGIDVIPYYCEEEATYNFCWEDDDPEAQHYMILEDEAGNEVVSVYANGACVTEVLEVGHYTMYLYHDGASSDSHALFIRPDSGAINLGVNSTVGTLNYSQAEVDTLLSTNKCEGCDLTGANLYRATLRKANLRGSDLSGAYLFGANLSWAWVSHVNFDGANLSWANLSHANLMGSDLSGAYLSLANLGCAIWTDGRDCDRMSSGTCNHCPTTVCDGCGW